MDLTDLLIFRTVVDEGGITKAAERLHRVQSNITTRVQQLEEKLGAELFIREGKKLLLAPAGRTLLPYADRMLGLAEEARNAVLDPMPRGLFRLGSMESTAAVQLPAQLARFHARYPEVTLELKTGNPQVLSAALLAGEIDAALVAEPVPDAPFEKSPAFSEDVIIVAAPGHPPIGPGTALPETIIVFETGCPQRRRLEAWYAERGEMPARTIEMASYHAMLGCVAAGMGIAIIPETVLGGFAPTMDLSVHRLPPEHARRETVLVWRHGAGTPNIRAFAELLAQKT